MPYTKDPYEMDSPPADLGATNTKAEGESNEPNIQEGTL